MNPNPKLTPADLVRDRFLATGMAAAAIASVAIFASAASAYPGGTHFDHGAPGHDFFRNTLCDVARSTAIGGQSNATGASLARTAMTLYAVALGLFYWLLPRELPGHPRLGRLVRTLGALSVPGAIAVVFLPTDRFGVLHGVAIVIAGVPGLAAAVLAVTALVRERAGAMAALGVAAFGAGAVDFVLYVRELVLDGPPEVAVSVLERAASVLLLVWMLALAGKTLRATSPAPVMRLGGVA